MSNIKLIPLSCLLRIENQLCVGFQKCNPGVDSIRTMPLSHMAYRSLTSYLIVSVYLSYLLMAGYSNRILFARNVLDVVSHVPLIKNDILGCFTLAEA